MKAFLIDPFERTITEVEYNGDYKHIYALIGCETFETIQIGDDGDAIYVDEEGLLGDLSKQAFFGVPSLYSQALAGKGLVLGSDALGGDTAPKITLEALKQLIQLPD